MHADHTHEPLIPRLEDVREALSASYAIEREIGAGGMATVYLARDLKHDRKVAVKVLRGELTSTLGKERFPREIRIIAQLSHPHILPLHDSGEAGGFLYFVMPFVEGESLRARLEREGQLPIHDAVRLMSEIVDALAYAHRHGVVHRDIKPDNVMLSGRHALITDFGVAKAVSAAAEEGAKHTTVGIALGTPSYMSPEQAMAEPTVDHRADIYALGAVAYEMLTGKPPFTGPTAQAILAAHVTGTAEPVTAARPAVTGLLNQVVMRCLEKNPADRWQTAEELMPLLEQAATPSGGMTPTDTRPLTGVRPPQKKSLRTVYAVAGALLLAVAAWFGRGMIGSAGAGGIDQIAVMPLEDISGGDAQFVQAMHDALISAIGKEASITVVSRSAVLQERAVTQSVREIARALRVNAVIEGSIYRTGDRVRLNVQMVEPESSRHLWTQSYERELTNETQMQVQDDVVKAIAAELAVAITQQTRN